HVYTILFPLIGLGTLKLDQGDFAGAIAPLERGLDLCRSRETPLLLHDFAWALGAACYGAGRRADGGTMMEEAAHGVAERRRRWSGWSGYVGALGRAYLLDGRLTEAIEIAQDGLAVARRLGERDIEGRRVRLLGDIAAHPDRGEADTAEAHYRQTLALAATLGLRPNIAHSHLGLGELYRRMGKRDQAREHLTMAIAMYREMDMRFWLEQAE